MKSVIGYQTQLPKASVVVKRKSKMEKIIAAVALAIGGVALIAVVGLLFSLPVMWLWNVALVPAIPGLVKIGWLQAWGILILCNFLFKPTVSSSKD
jgi:hypothetical protein